MKVLISWSGRNSREIAEVLKEWLPKIVLHLDPWISTQDIDKGARWRNELQNVLGTADACIVCLTPDNVNSPWLYWETGAVATRQENPICPLLVNIDPAEIQNTPLADFQGAYNRKDDVWNLVRTLNQRLPNPEGDDPLKGRFEKHWEQLDNAFTRVAETSMPSNIRSLVRGLKDARAIFVKQWNHDFMPNTLDPLRELVNDTVRKVDHLAVKADPDSRIRAHCAILKTTINSVMGSSSRETVKQRAEDVPAAFDTAIDAIKAGFG